MRILHLGKYYTPERGGIERHTQALAEACVRHGDAVGVLVHQRPGAWRRAQSVIGGVEVRRAGCLAAPLYTPLSPGFPFELARALRELRPQLLHLHFPNPSCFAALLLPAARRLPWIVHWHADVPPDAPDWRLRWAYRAYRPFEQAVLRRARAIIATSQSYLDASQALADWHAKTHVVPLGIAAAEPAGGSGAPLRCMREPVVAVHADETLPELPDAAPGPRCGEERFARWRNGTRLRLLAVGRLSRYKGFDVLVEALARTADAHLLLVGSGECERELHAQATRRGVADRIAFAGELDDDALAAAYASADAFVLPSRDRGEAFGLVLLEAMRAGLPVVASAIEGSGVGEVVVDGETGLLVPPEDATALADALARIRDDTFLRQRLGAGGHARWQNTFTLDRSAQATRAIYREVLQSGT